MRISKITAAGVMAIVGLGLAGMPKADAAYIAYLYQDGSNVVGTGSGSLNLAALTLSGTDITDATAALEADEAMLALGPIAAGAGIDYYLGISGPASYGSGSEFFAESGSSGNIIIISQDVTIGVPTGYTSGDALGTSTDTWDNTTLAALGVTDGTYTWTWGTGLNADSFILHVGEAPGATGVPEPASLALFGTAVAALGLSRRRRAW